MEAYLIWLLAGLALVITELITGTFYLLVLGVAAFGAGAAAWLGGGFPLQGISAAAVAGLARVRYRGASWDARIEGSDAPQPGAVLYVLAAEGNTLRVSAKRPAQ